MTFGQFVRNTVLNFRMLLTSSIGGGNDEIAAREAKRHAEAGVEIDRSPSSGETDAAERDASRAGASDPAPAAAAAEPVVVDSTALEPTGDSPSGNDRANAGADDGVDAGIDAGAHPTATHTPGHAATGHETAAAESPTDWLSDAAVGHNKVADDTVTGDTVTADTVTGDTVLGDTVLGDTVLGDTVLGEARDDAELDFDPAPNAAARRAEAVLDAPSPGGHAVHDAALGDPDAAGDVAEGVGEDATDDDGDDPQASRGYAQGVFDLDEDPLPPEIHFEAHGRVMGLTAALEALLFVSDTAVETAQFAKALNLSPEQIEVGLTRLTMLYRREGRGLRLMDRGGRFQLVTMPEAAGIIEDYLNLDLSTRLSGPALETLAVIAYRQPVTRAQVEAVRGVDCSGVIRSLLQRGLIEDAGRLETVGRPILYSVTDLFMQHFGLTGMHELPELKTEEADTLWAATELAFEEEGEPGMHTEDAAHEGTDIGEIEMGEMDMGEVDAGALDADEGRIPTEDEGTAADESATT